MKLSADQIQEHLAKLSGWSLNEAGELTKTYKRKNFLDGLGFVTQIAVFAERAGHHPDVLLTWPSVQIRLTTHDAGGLTENDFKLAAEIDTLTD
jgi:4a-hydroxytetrahydrobiopterin dehydratase